jgi:hypothetical protein
MVALRFYYYRTQPMSVFISLFCWLNCFGTDQCTTQYGHFKREKYELNYKSETVVTLSRATLTLTYF